MRERKRRRRKRTQRRKKTKEREIKREELCIEALFQSLEAMFSISMS
jgi:hypothetical protein